MNYTYIDEVDPKNLDLKGLVFEYSNVKYTIIENLDFSRKYQFLKIVKNSQPNSSDKMQWDFMAVGFKFHYKNIDFSLSDNKLIHDIIEATLTDQWI